MQGTHQAPRSAGNTSSSMFCREYIRRHVLQRIHPGLPLRLDGHDGNDRYSGHDGHYDKDGHNGHDGLQG